MRPEDAELILTLFAFLVLISQVFFAVFVLLLLVIKSDKKNPAFKKINSFFSQTALPFAFLMAFAATFGSMFMSTIAKIPPCDLCWYQRIFMFPQVVLLGIATFTNDFGVRKYILWLSGIGAAIAIYHYTLQFSPVPLPCTGVSNCASKQIVYFNYLTIPMMSLTAFAYTFVFALLMPSGKEKK